MSINITVHKSQPSSSSSKNPFASLESVRKAENDKLRKTRLEQVRQQSKLLAAKVRRKVEVAKQKELDKVNKLKQAELKSWKQKHIAKLQTDYQLSLEDVGEAHKAAEAAQQCEIWFQEKRAAQQATAIQRGRQAEAKLAQDKQDRENKKPKKRKEYKPTKSVAVQAYVAIDGPKKDVPIQVDDSSCSVNTISAFEEFKKGSKAYAVIDLHSQEPPLPHGFVSSEEEQPISSGKNKENVPLYNTECSKQVDTLYYNPSSFTSPDTLQHHSSVPQLKPFTQVSDFIRRRREDRSNKYTYPVASAPKDITTYSSQKIVQFDDMSENTLSFPTSTALDRSILESPRKPVQKLIAQPRVLPIKTQSKGSPSKQSATISSLDQGTSKVQYYDYNTKFRKEYDQPSSFVQRNDKPKEGELNAMQEAQRLEHLQRDMLNARMQVSVGPDRSKIALEKLQTRKDYENLQKELDKLVKAESQVKALDATSKPFMTESRQRQQSEARQKRMNEAVEDLLKQRVLITCPVVRDPPQGVQLVNRSSQVNVASGTGNTGQLLDDDSNHGAASNTSDSCSTILLGYDKRKSRAAIPLPESDKVAKLKELLEQINEQKKLLTEELKKEEEIEQELKVPLVHLNSKKTQTDNGIKKMQQRQKEIEQQQKMLQAKEREILDLEKQLKEKLNSLEKVKPKLNPELKTPIHIETKRSKHTNVQSVLDTSSTGSNESIRSGSDIPVKIIITVNDKSKKKIRKTPKKMLPEARKRKQASDIPDHGSSEPPKSLQKPHILNQNLKKDNMNANFEATKQEEASPISSTTSTVYRQLPKKIDNRVGQFLDQLAHSELPKGTQPPDQPTDFVPKHQLKKIIKPTMPHQTRQPSQSQQLNPNLMQYIIRLLGMSRQSIEQLGVSSSTTVSTPHESVVNVSENQSSADEQASRDQSRMDKLRRFIDENYNFLNEIDETLKEQEMSGTIEENISRVEDVWMKTLSRKEKEIRRAEIKSPQPTPPEQSPQIKESSLKSILKSPKNIPSNVAKIKTPQGHVEVINLSDRDEQEVLEKYSHLAESCSKRISELTDMIQKVRQEKKKLIENSLSSSDQPESSTKYMDFPKVQQGGPGMETSPRSTKDDPVSEEINNIFNNARQFGLSKDSGIAMSRPVTSSDYRDSPDTRAPNAGAPQFESSEDLSSRDVAHEPYEPVLKDIPKIASRVAPKEGPSLSKVDNSKTNVLPLAKRSKPPVAIIRYSPQLEEVTAAHELSTIPEVETPLASRINISIPPSEKLDPAEQLLVEARDRLLEHARVLGYEDFPNYQQYVREQNLESTRYDPEKTSTTRLNELMDVSEKPDLRYQKFPEPAPEMNFTEETIKGSVNGQKPELESNSSSSTSLPDVVAELKLRNIIDKSFNNSLDDSNRSTPNSGSLECLHPVPKTTKSPTKSMQNGVARSPERSVSETTASLERDLNQLGLRWASTMLKKNQQAQLQEHSSSSSLSPAEEIRRGSGRRPKTFASLPNDPNDSIATTGKPLNLKEFIARELMIRTHSDLNSLSDSSSPCSLLLRSLLDISNINTSTPELLTQTTTDRNIQRTSTPVATKSSASTPRENDRVTKDGSLNVTNGLFSGESRISSVHMSSSSGGENRLTAPNVRLNLDKYTDEKGSQARD